jgi:hypothetical protein
MLSEIVKVVDRGGGGFKMWSSDLVCRKIFSVCRKSTAFGPPKKHGSHGATGNASVSNGLKNDQSYEFIGEVILKINIV